MTCMIRQEATVQHNEGKCMRFHMRATATRIHGAESLFVSSDLTAWLLHPRYPPRSIRYEKECRRSGIYSRDDEQTEIFCW